jgi:hypothetical protein
MAHSAEPRLNVIKPRPQLFRATLDRIEPVEHAVDESSEALDHRAEESSDGTSHKYEHRPVAVA